MPSPTAPAASPETPQAEAPRPQSRSHTKQIIGVVVVILIAGAIAAYFYYRNRATTDDAQIQGHVQPVAPRIAGTVVQVDVDDNQMVHAGEVLFRLDDSDYKAALAQAQASLAAVQAAAASAQSNVPITTASSSGTLSAAQAALAQAQAGEKLSAAQVAAADAEVSAAQAARKQAQAQAENATSVEQRYQQLVAKQEISALQFQQAQTAAVAAQAGVAAATARVAAAQQQVASAVAKENVARSQIAEAAANERKAASAPQLQAVSRAQAQSAQAKVAQAEAAVAMAQLNVDYTTVRAPSDGEVGNKNVELGQHFAPGQTALVVVPINDVWVVANYKETQLENMHAGQPAEVSVDAFGVTLKARVNSLGAGTGSIFSLLPPENATGNYVKVVQRMPVKLVFEQGQNLSRLRPGMSVEVTVFTNK